MSNDVYSGLSHNYSVWYPKSVWLFPNANEYKLWSYMFSQYVFQSKYPDKYGDPKKIDIYKTYLSKYLNQSTNTIDNCLKHMQSIGVISRSKFASQCTLNISYVLGALSLVNSTSDEDVLVEISESFSSGDKDKLKQLGLKYCPDFEVPSVSSLQFSEGSQILGTSGDFHKNWEPTSQKLGTDSQNLGNSLQNTTTFTKNGDKSSQNLGTLEDFHKICETFELMSDEFPKNWEGEVILKFSAGNIVNFSVFDPQNSIQKFPKFVKLLPKICESGTQNLGNWYSKFVNIILYIDNNKIKRNYTDFDSLEEENKILREQINVLLKKNQNSSTGESEDSNEFFEVGFSSSNKKTLQDEVDEIVGKIRNSFNMIGEWVPCTEREISEYDKAKLQDRTVQDVIRSVKDKFIDGSQVNAKTFFDYLKELTEESFSVELDEPEDGSFDNYSIDDFALADLSDDTMTDAEREQAISVKSIYELKRFCMKEYKQLFPFFKWEGMNIQVYYHQCEEKTLIERQREFKELHERVSHQFSKEDIALDDYDKKFKVIDAFNDRFPENQTFPYSTMVEGLQDLMIDINLFSSMDIEYNSYNILDGFHGSIKVVYDHLEDTAHRLPQKTIGEEREALARERSKNTLESLKSAANSVKSDDIDYGDLLLGYRPPRVKISEEKIIPANPALLAAFKHLGFKNGHVLEEWELNQICDAVIKKYNQRGHGLSAFSNTVTCVTMIGNGHRYELRGLSEPIVEDPVEEEPRPYVRRQRARRGS